MSHRVRFARVIQVAAWRSEYGEAVKGELAEVQSLPLGEMAHLVRPYYPYVATAEDELTGIEGAVSEYS